MKRLLFILAFLAMGMFFVSGVLAYDPPAPAPGSGINLTVHDLGTAHNGMNYIASPPDEPLVGQPARICIFCHAPHNTYRLAPANGGPGAGVGSGPQAAAAFDYLPLWNHELTGQYASYTMYQPGPGAPTIGHAAPQVLGTTMVPGGTSLLCLSCHDGSIAVNSYGNTSQPAGSRSSGGGLIGAAYVIGKDNYMGNHHPIGFNYDTVAGVDTQLRGADSTSFGGAGTIRDHLYGAGNTQVECGTCHSVHNKGNTGEALLWRSDAASRLCLTCHDKGTDPGATTP